nr:unnamed protein product [Digitaria exilis]
MDPSLAKAAAAAPVPPSGNAADHVLLIPPDHHPPPQPHASNNPQQHPAQNPEKPPAAAVSSPSRPPRSPALLRRRSSIAKPKSRFVEPPTPTHPDSTHPSPAHPSSATPTHRAAAGAISTPHTPAEPDEEEDLFRNRDGSTTKASAARCRKRARLGLEVSVLVLFLALLIVSRLVPQLKGQMLWGLEIWKWCVMVTAVFSGHLLSHWIVTLIVFVVERNFLLRTKVLYFKMFEVA